MLSDHEREALHEIQAGLLVEDPRFAQSFDTETQSLDTKAQRPHRSSPDQTRRLYTILLVLSSTYAVIMLLAGSPISALALAAMAGMSWEARRRQPPATVTARAQCRVWILTYSAFGLARESARRDRG